MISLLVVNYRSAALTAEAIRTARASASSALQVVIVDNSCDPAEAERLCGLGDVLLLAETNRGYAGGVNLGRRSCEGETIVVSNPDVVFGEGAIDRLVDELRGKVAVAGPALFWDDAHRWMLPPGDLGTAREKIDAILASRSRNWFEQRDRRRFLQRVAFWELDHSTEVRMLSGAVMAIRAKDFDALYGFDERFPLYFEEADFLRRTAAIRRRIVYVPAARCRHLFNQSAVQVADSAAARYAQSEMRYLEKWNGPWAARMLKRLEKPMPSFEIAPTSSSSGSSGNLALPDSRTFGVRGASQEKPRRGTPRNPRNPQSYAIASAPSTSITSIGEGDFVIEASPLPSFATAAGRFTNRPDDLSLPPDVLASIRGVPFHLRSVVRRTGEVLATVRISA